MTANPHVLKHKEKERKFRHQKRDTGLAVMGCASHYLITEACWTPFISVAQSVGCFDHGDCTQRAILIARPKDLALTCYPHISVAPDAALPPSSLTPGPSPDHETCHNVPFLTPPPPFLANLHKLMRSMLDHCSGCSNAPPTPHQILFQAVEFWYGMKLELLCCICQFFITCAVPHTLVATLMHILACITITYWFACRRAKSIVM